MRSSSKEGSESYGACGCATRRRVAGCGPRRRGSYRAGSASRSISSSGPASGKRSVYAMGETLLHVGTSARHPPTSARVRSPQANSPSGLLHVGASAQHPQFHVGISVRHSRKPGLDRLLSEICRDERVQRAQTYKFRSCWPVRRSSVAPTSFHQALVVSSPPANEHEHPWGTATGSVDMS